MGFIMVMVLIMLVTGHKIGIALVHQIYIPLIEMDLLHIITICLTLEISQEGIILVALNTVVVSSLTGMVTQILSLQW